jgi:hypothetical protein
MVWNIGNAVSALRENAEAGSVGKCAHYTADAIEAGGVALGPRPISAKDFGPILSMAGFAELLSGPQQFKAGDVAVVQPCAGHPHGHMAMFDGSGWYSDFRQNSFSCPPDPYPGKDYRLASPPYKVYRHPP